MAHHLSIVFDVLRSYSIFSLKELFHFVIQIRKSTKYERKNMFRCSRNIRPNQYESIFIIHHSHWEIMVRNVISMNACVVGVYLEAMVKHLHIVQTRNKWDLSFHSSSILFGGEIMVALLLPGYHEKKKLNIKRKNLSTFQMEYYL